jgi:hypothetical protein
MTNSDHIPPDQRGIAPLFLLFVPILFEDPMDYSSDFIGDDPTWLNNLSSFWNDRIDRSFPRSLSPENLSSDSVMSHTSIFPPQCDLYEEEFGHGWAKTNEPFFTYPGQKGMSVYKCLSSPVIIREKCIIILKFPSQGWPGRAILP